MIRKLAAAAVLAALVPAAQAQETKVLFNSFIQPKHPYNTHMLNVWLADVTKATGGRVKFEVPPSSLAAPPQQYDSTVKGIMDAAYQFHGFLADRVKLAQVAHLPWGTTNPVSNSRALWLTHEKYFAKADEYKDVQLLALFVALPGTTFSMKEPIQAVKDLKGLKIFGLPGVPARVLEMAGAAVVAQPAVRSHEVISSGTVDAFSGYSVTDAVAFHTLGYAKSITDLPGHLSVPSFAMFMNKKKWQSIPQQDRDIITKMAGAGFAKYLAPYIELEEKARQEAAAKGIKIGMASEAFVAELRKIAEPLEQSWLADAQKLGVDGKAALAFYRQESKRAP
jgi:TRAP-type C4-dicarboxylate transport system substrate-binding protein